MKTIVTAVIKGGTGKTTTAAALAQAAAIRGKRVLAVDLDPQANFTCFLGGDPNKPGAYQILHGTPAAEVLQKTAQEITVIPGNPDLATEKSTPGSAQRLREALEPLQGRFDLCIIDTPPQMGELLFTALAAADGLIIPLEADDSSVQGLYQITDIAREMKGSNPALKVYGVVITRFDERPKINRHLQKIIAAAGEECGAPLLATIRPGVAIREAQALRKSLYKYAASSKPAIDYNALFSTVGRISGILRRTAFNEVPTARKK